MGSDDSAACALDHLWLGRANQGCFFKDEEEWEEACAGIILRGPSLQPWDPFLRFLKRRRGEIRESLNSAAALPLPLISQLDAYLPEVPYPPHSSSDDMEQREAFLATLKSLAFQHAFPLNIQYWCSWV